MLILLKDASNDETCDRSALAEIGDHVEDLRTDESSAADVGASNDFLVSNFKAASDKRSRGKSSEARNPGESVDFFLDEKYSLRPSVSRGLDDELSNLAKDVKGSSFGTKNSLTSTGGTRTANVKRQSRRSSTFNRGRKARMAASANKEMVVYRSTRCLGQMLNLVLKQVIRGANFINYPFTHENRLY